jgi:ACR3 family arsenite transporter
MAGGRAQLTLVGVILTFFLSILIVPFYGHWMLHSMINVPIYTLFEAIVLYVIIPLGVGQTLKYFILRYKGQEGLEKIRDSLSLLSLIGLYWMVMEVFGMNGSILLKLSFTTVGLIAFMYLYNLSRFGIAYYAGKLAKLPKDRIISLFYSSTTNMTLSTAVAIGAFGAIAGIGTILVGPFSEMILMILFVKLLRR